MEGRKTGTKGNEKARLFILQRIKEAGLIPFKSKYQHTFEFNSSGNDFVGHNLIATINGQKSNEKAIVVSAHYDHVGTKSGQIYNGADDNASGTAALLAISEYFAKNGTRHKFIFAFFDAEESGLIGAKSFVEQNPDSIILNINLDMISRSEDREIYVAGTHQNPNLKELVLEAIPDDSMVKVLFGHDHPGSGGHDWTNSGDHGPFNAAGIPFLYFGVEDHEDYHKPTDDFEKIDLNFYSSVVDLIISVIESLDKNLE